MELLWIVKPNSPLLRVALNRARPCPSEIANEASEVVAEDDDVELHNDDGLNPDSSQPIGGTTESKHAVWNQ